MYAIITITEKKFLQVAPFYADGYKITSSFKTFSRTREMVVWNASNSFDLIFNGVSLFYGS